MSNADERSITVLLSLVGSLGVVIGWSALLSHALAELTTLIYSLRLSRNHCRPFGSRGTCSVLLLEHRMPISTFVGMSLLHLCRRPL